MKALIVEGKVAQVAEESFEVSTEWFWVDCPDDCKYGWIYENGVLSPPPVIQPTPDEMIAQYSKGIQDYLDSVARGKEYTDSIYCISYASSSIEKWKNEALAFLNWRDSVWTYALGELPKFLSGERPVVSLEQFIAELPAIVWPV